MISVLAALCSRRSTSVSQHEGQSLSETDTAPVAVSCPECRRVYTYEYRQAKSFLWPEAQGQEANRQKYPTVTFVPLVCDVVGCDTPLVVTAARAADTPIESVLAEVPGWTLHDLKCPSDRPILVPKILGTRRIERNDL